jgi:hypothetical protein
MTAEQIRLEEARQEKARHPRTDCLELTLLLPVGQFLVLEKSASRWELTVGQFVRRLIRDYISTQHDGSNEEFGGAA